MSSTALPDDLDQFINASNNSDDSTSSRQVTLTSFVSIFASIDSTPKRSNKYFLKFNHILILDILPSILLNIRVIAPEQPLHDI